MENALVLLAVIRTFAAFLSEADNKFALLLALAVLSIEQGVDVRAVPTNETPVRLWNAITGTLLRDFRTSKPCGSDSKEQFPVSPVSIRPDGRHLVGAVLATGQTWVRDVRTGAVIAELPTVRSTGSAVFSPDGSRIVTGSRLQGVVQVWEKQGQQPIAHFERSFREFQG